MSLAVVTIVVLLMFEIPSTESQGVTGEPYLQLDGRTLNNNSYIDIDRAMSAPISCRVYGYGELDEVVTLNVDWNNPFNQEVPRTSEGVHTIGRESSIALDVDSKSITQGLYSCTSRKENNVAVVYIGIYSIDSGNVNVSQIMLSVDSDLNGPSPQFTLTCISTGGPATTVTWTRDSTTITEGTETVLNDPVTAQYTHTLTVTGISEGNYICAVYNNKPSLATTYLTVLVGAEPTNLRMCQMSATSILLEWNPSINNSFNTGYEILYLEHSGSKPISHSVIVPRANDDGREMNWYILMELTPEGTYTISMRGISLHYPSNYTQTSSITLSSDSMDDQCSNAMKYHICDENVEMCAEEPSDGSNNTATTNICSDIIDRRRASIIAGTLIVGVLLGAAITGIAMGGAFCCFTRRSRNVSDNKQRSGEFSLTANKAYLETNDSPPGTNDTTSQQSTYEAPLTYNGAYQGRRRDTGHLSMVMNSAYCNSENDQQNGVRVISETPYYSYVSPQQSI